ncbi:MAG: molybdate ABC transporter substrate-binding protein [Vicinamibacterales bacterium]
MNAKHNPAGRSALRRQWWLAGWLCLVVVAAGCRSAPESPARRGRVRVAAASDLNAALSDLITHFGGSHDVDVTVSYGSSGTFYTQLLNQAPFDLFLSADVAYPNQLTARGLTLPQSEFTYAIGRLVLWTAAASPLDVAHDGMQALTQPSVAHVAIANPEYAPYGRAAVAALRAAGIYDRVQPKLVLGENVAQALQFVQSGAADAGLIAMSLAVAPNVKGKGRLFEVPASSYPRLQQGGTILKWAADVDAARALRGFLLSADGQSILERYGFSLPDR